MRHNEKMGSIIKNTYDYTYDNNNQLSSVQLPVQGYITYNSYTWNMPNSITLPGGTKRENEMGSDLKIEILPNKKEE